MGQSKNERMLELVELLNKASRSYYQDAQEIMSNYEYDRLYDELQNLEKELEKLFCYCMGKEEIEISDIEAICTTQITNKIFDMVEAVAMKNQNKALDYYYDLLALKEPPMRILYLLTRQFKLLLEVKDLVGKRYDKSSIAKTVGLHPFVAGKYMQQCRTFEKKELRSILEDAVDTEELVKTGRLNDVMSVELFIVKYSAA